jgi:tRNA threonylcarbamoyladenosine biosynthesis protein TsaE
VEGASDVIVNLPDEAATSLLAARLASRARKGDVIALAGELGSGKTTFARAFIRARGLAAAEVPSPTFTLVEIYDGDPPVWHFDLYRLARAEEIRELGFEEALAESIILVEWPDRLGDGLPSERLELTLAAGSSPASRVATLAASPAWRGRLAGLRDV